MAGRNTWAISAILKPGEQGRAIKRAFTKPISQRPQWDEQTRRWVVDQIGDDVRQFLAFYDKPIDFGSMDAPVAPNGPKRLANGLAGQYDGPNVSGRLGRRTPRGSFSPFFPLTRGLFAVTVLMEESETELPGESSIVSPPGTSVQPGQ